MWTLGSGAFTQFDQNSDGAFFVFFSTQVGQILLAGRKVAHIMKLHNDTNWSGHPGMIRFHRTRATALVKLENSTITSIIYILERCAYIHEHNDYWRASGKQETIPRGVQARTIGSFNNRVSTVYVAPSCVFAMFDGDSFTGANKILHGQPNPDHSLGTRFQLASDDKAISLWNDRVSSYMCTCD